MHAPDRLGPRRGRYPFQGSRRDGNLQEQSIRTTLPGRAHRIYSSAREHRPHAVRRTILPRTDATAARPHSVTPGRFPRPSGDVTASARRFRIGLEAGPLSQWLHAGLRQAGFQTVLLETRHVKAALSAMTVKTDRKDARGLAQLLRMGWFQQVHAKSIGSQEIRALLVARKQLLGRLLDVELSIRGILRGFGLKVGQVTRKTFEARIRELVTGQATLERIAEAMLSARATLQAQYEKLHKAVLAFVRDD